MNASNDSPSCSWSLPKVLMDDVLCPVCLEPPHNAVLLTCSSAEKGCYPLVCDTSKRHSNCLDQYKKAQLGEDAAEVVAAERAREASTRPGVLQEHNPRVPTTSSSVDRRVDCEDPASLPEHNPRVPTTSSSVDRRVDCDDPAGLPEQLNISTGASGSATEMLEGTAHGLPSPCSGADRDKHLACPLCRGRVRGWKVVSDVRDYLNQKIRPCAEEACSFQGRYNDLRHHARVAHPDSKPTRVKPEREAAWKRLERQWEMGDVMSSIRSSGMRGMIVGDYIIEEDDEHDDGPEFGDFPGDDGRHWTVFLLPLIFGRDGHGAPGAAMRRHLPRPRFARGVGGNRRPLWGEPVWFRNRHPGRGRERDAMQERLDEESDSGTELEDRAARRLGGAQGLGDAPALVPRRAREPVLTRQRAFRFTDAESAPPTEVSDDDFLVEVERQEQLMADEDRPTSGGSRPRSRPPALPFRRRRAWDTDADWPDVNLERPSNADAAPSSRRSPGSSPNGRVFGVPAPTFGQPDPPRLEPGRLGPFLAARFGTARQAEPEAGSAEAGEARGPETVHERVPRRPEMTAERRAELARRVRERLQAGGAARWQPAWNGNRRWSRPGEEGRPSEGAAEEVTRGDSEQEERRRRRWDREFGASAELVEGPSEARRSSDEDGWTID